jgi:hypothetical protein
VCTGTAGASMKLSSLILYFITGGLFTAMIVTLEENG